MARPPPKPESNGCCRARSRQKESMVEMRSWAGRSSSFQPSAWERSNARRARALGCSARSSSRILLRISAAAALVKVMATTWPGSSTSPSRVRKRSVSNVVLPEPAGACTRMERVGSRARSRWGWSGGGDFHPGDEDLSPGTPDLAAVLLIGRLRMIVAVGVVFVFELDLIFLNAAEGLQAAALAGFGGFARVDFGVAGEEVLSELLDGLAPIDELLGGKRVFDQGAVGFEAGEESGFGIANPTGKCEVACAHLGNDEAAEDFIFAFEGKAGVERSEEHTSELQSLRH